MRKTFIRDAVSFFFLYGIIFIPFPFYLLKKQLQVTDFLFGKLISIVSQNIFGQALPDTKVYSDYVSMYALVLLLLILAIITALLINLWKGWPQYRDKVLRIFYTLFYCYLSLQLLKYGADKIFKNQFYLPEPNILYTPLGRVNKDLLYWSSMGTSHFYSVFLGSLEIVAAVLIFTRRFRPAGLLLSFGILLNVVVINFAFDISVKLFSIFLFFLTAYLSAPYFSRIARILFSTGKVKAHPQAEPLLKNVFLSGFLKWFAAGIICLESLYPVLKSGQVNGDLAPRPFLHGAYQVTIPAAGHEADSAEQAIRRFYIHKDGYLIFEDQDNNMKDYRLQYDTVNKRLLLTDYEKRQITVEYAYAPYDSILILRFPGTGGVHRIIGKEINWRKMPALQKGFHWTVDGNY